MPQRCLDVLMSLTGIVMFAPVYLVIALLIYLEDRGPVFFLQPRLGRHRQQFRIYKFRTMRGGQVTRVGRWLRRTGLDEIPQFFNILCGKMSVVGPRPLTQADVTRLGWNRAFHDARWEVRPGLTGLAQLHAGRSAKHSWLFDQTYALQRGALLDAQIIALSFVINLVGKTRMRQWLRTRRTKARRGWRRWEQFFEARKARPLPTLQASAWPRDLPPSVARSLAVFQLGESGGGTVVSQVRGSAYGRTHPSYARAMALFVDEEHRHAEILALAVDALGGKLIEKNWTDSLFVLTRRAMGIRLKALVLLAAEVVGMTYYRLIAERAGVAQLRSVLDELCTDEEDHLQFHCEFLRRQTPGAMHKWIFSATWYAVTSLALLVVYIDHRRALSDLRIPRREVFGRWRANVALANGLVVNPANGSEVPGLPGRPAPFRPVPASRNQPPA